MYSYLPFASSILFLCQCARGFHWKPGPRCEPGEQCSYLYQVESGVEQTKVEGWCAPNYHCADNGAKCESDENCFGWCSDGICGGSGSICNTQAPFEHTDIHWEYSCFTPEFECTTEGTLGVCKRADVNRRRPFAHDFKNSEADLNVRPKTEQKAKPHRGHRHTHSSPHSTGKHDPSSLVFENPDPFQLPFASDELHAAREAQEKQFQESMGTLNVAKKLKSEKAWGSLLEPAREEDHWETLRNQKTLFEVDDLFDDEETEEPVINPATDEEDRDLPESEDMLSLDDVSEEELLKVLENIKGTFPELADTTLEELKEVWAAMESEKAGGA